MCGRFVLAASRYELAERFGVDEVVTDELGSRWNVAPSQPVYAIVGSRDGSSRLLDTFRWGLVPSWAEDRSTGSRMINARCETVASIPAFRSAFATRRCLIPADGFYEWKRGVLAGPSRPATRRVPYYFHPSGGTLALGGIWEVWHDEEGGRLRTCAIVTTAANASVAKVHDRMPVVVASQDWGRWLAPNPLDEYEQARLLAPAAEGVLFAERVSTSVDSPASDGPELIEPMSEPA